MMSSSSPSLQEPTTSQTEPRKLPPQPTAHVRTDSNGMESISSGNSISSSHSTNNESNAKMKKKKKSRPKLQPITSPEKSLTGEEDPEDIFFGDVYAKRDSARVLMDNKHVDCGTSLEKNESSSIESGKKGGNSSEMQEAKGITQMNDYSANLSERVERNTPQLPEAGEVASSSISNIPQDFPGASNPDVEATEMEPMMEADSSANNNNQKRKIDFNQPPETASPESSHSSTTSVSRLSQATIATNDTSATRTTSSETCTPNASNLLSQPHTLGNDHFQEDRGEDANEIDTVELSQPELFEIGDELGEATQKSRPGEHRANDRYHQSTKPSSLQQRLQTSQNQSQSRQPFHTSQVEQHAELQQQQQQQEQQQQNLQHDQLNSPIDSSDFQTPTKAIRANDTTDSKQSSVAKATQAGSGHTPSRPTSHVPATGEHDKDTIKSTSKRPHPPKPNLKLQPRAALFSPEKVPDSPDDDGWFAFGFGLVKTPHSDDEEENSEDDAVGDEVGPGGGSFLKKITMDDSTMQSSDGGDGDEKDKGEDDDVDRGISNIGSEMSTPQKSNKERKELVSMEDKFPAANTHQYPALYPSGDDENDESQFESESEIPSRRGSMMSDDLLGEDFNKDDDEDDDEAFDDSGRKEGHCNLTTKDESKGILRASSYKSGSIQPAYPKDELEEYVEKKRQGKNSDDDNERKTPTREVDDLAYSLDQEEPALARETSTRTSQSNLSSISQLSAASFNESALEIDKSANNESAQEKSDTVHLIGGSNPRSSSEEDLNNDDDDDVSFESDSTFAPSDGESSYFSAKRASMERQSHLQPNHYYHHFHPQNFHQHMQHAPRSMSQYGQPLYYYQMQPAQPFSQQLPLNPYSLQMQQQPHRTQRNQGQQPAQYFTPAGNSTLRRPPSRPVNLPLRSNSGPVYASSAYSGGVSRQAVEMKLSLSADDDDEKDGVGTSYDLTETDVTTDERGKELPLFRRSSRGKGDLSCCSSIVESASSDDEVDIALQNHQSTAHLKSGEQWKSATPFSNSSASTDDAGVMNELSAYVSSPGKSEELTTNDDPYNSGRLTPVDGRRVASVLKDDTELSNFNTDTPTPTHAGGARNFYADTQSAMMAASSQISAAKPLAQSDSSYLNQFCGNWNNKSGVGDTGSVGSAVHKSPRGAFKETDRRSPSQLLSSQPITEMPYQSSPRTPKNHHLQLQSSWSGEGRVGGQSSVEPQSLAYSDEDDIDHGRSGVKPSSLQNVLDGAGSDDNAKDAVIDQTQAQDGENKFKVYSSRWIMLIYMSVLNLLSDWTCYSVAPIAVLTSEKFGNDVDPESLVTVFLSANAVASACEPAILGRLGLRRTVVFGALLLMVGSIIKSGGSPLLGQSLGDGDGWRVYLGFFLVGLSQPLYQCTPALLSASWFPENERTMATGIALNSNQLGIGFAFVFGTLLVAKPDDIVPYFQLLSFIATVSFIGCAMQFDDAPPTPPSDTARVIRGTLEIKIPNLPGMFFICGKEDNEERESTSRRSKSSRSSSHHGSRNKRDSSDVNSNEKFKHRRHLSSSERRKSREASGGKGGKKKTKKKKKTSETPRHNEAPTLPSPAIGDEPTVLAMESIESDGNIAEGYGRLRQTSSTERTFDDEPMSYYGSTSNYAPTTPLPMLETPNDRTSDASDGVTNSPFANLHSYYVQPGGMIYQPGIGYYDINEQFFPEKSLPPTEDEGVEPVMTQTPHQLGITVRDDQVWLSFKSCFARKGFAHCVVAFTTSGIVVNTLSTFMDYLVQLQGAERKYVGIVGGTFQLLIMIASMIFGSWTDKSRKYYFAIMALLVLGAFMLSVCSVDLDGDRGGDLRWNLLAVGVLAGPLQPLSTELGVEVVYPLSENTVLVIQQLFSNLLSAAFIPVFKMLRDVGTKSDDLDSNAHMFEVPQYTFSFYMLVVIHALATIYFASFNGSYLRFEEENRKKREKERKRFDLEAKRQRPRFRFPYGRAPVIDENFPFLIPQNYGMV